MEKLLRERYGERQAAGNAFVDEVANIPLPTSAAVMGKMSEKQRAKFAKMRAAQEAAGELDDSDPPTPKHKSGRPSPISTVKQEAVVGELGKTHDDVQKRMARDRSIAKLMGSDLRSLASPHQ